KDRPGGSQRGPHLVGVHAPDGSVELVGQHRQSRLGDDLILKFDVHRFPLLRPPVPPSGYPTTWRVASISMAAVASGASVPSGRKISGPIRPVTPWASS